MNWSENKALPTDTELINRLDRLFEGTVKVSFERIWLNGHVPWRWQISFECQFESKGEQAEFGRMVRGGGVTFREALNNAFKDLDAKEVDQVAEALQR